MGFGRQTSRPDRWPDMLVLGRISPRDLSGLDAIDAPFDALLIETENPVEDLNESAIEALGDSLWGIRTGRLTAETAEGVKAAGADFAVFCAAGTDGSVLMDSHLDKFLEIDIGLDEETSHAVGSLPLNGVAMVVDDEMVPPTVETIMRLHRAITSGAHALLVGGFDPKVLSSGDLENMRSMGVSALALPAADAEGIRHLSETIRSIPEPRFSQDGPIALIPQPAPAPADPDEYDL